MDYRADAMIAQNKLRHFGILGMKWGVRRFQNEDGSLTAAGRKRYGVGGEDSKIESKKAKLTDLFGAHPIFFNKNVNIKKLEDMGFDGDFSDYEPEMTKDIKDYNPTHGNPVKKLTIDLDGYELAQKASPNYMKVVEDVHDNFSSYDRVARKAVVEENFKYVDKYLKEKLPGTTEEQRKKLFSKNLGTFDDGNKPGYIYCRILNDCSGEISYTDGGAAGGHSFTVYLDFYTKKHQGTTMDG